MTSPTNPQDPAVIAFVEAKFSKPYDQCSRQEIDQGWFAWLGTQRDADQKYGVSEAWWRAEGKP